MIEQIFISSIVKSFLVMNLPQFIESLKDREDGSFDCTWRSPDDLFAIWIAAYNSEITVGIEDPEGDSGIHTHITCYEEEDVQVALDQLSEIIRNISDNKLVLFNSSLDGYKWSDDIVGTVMNKKSKEIIKVFFWNK